MIYSFVTYGTGAGDNFDECLLDLAEVQAISARLPTMEGVVAIRLTMKDSPTMFCGLLHADYLMLVRVLKAVRGEVLIDGEGCVKYVSEEGAR